MRPYGRPDIATCERTSYVLGIGWAWNVPVPRAPVLARADLPQERALGLVRIRDLPAAALDRRRTDPAGAPSGRLTRIRRAREPRRGSPPPRRGCPSRP